MQLWIATLITLISFSANAVQEGFISSPNGPVKVQYTIDENGTALLEGDMEIDPKETADEITTMGAGKWLWFRKWPNKVIPYVIDPNMPDVARIEWAIEHIHQNTQFKMVFCRKKVGQTIYPSSRLVPRSKRGS